MQRYARDVLAERRRADVLQAGGGGADEDDAALDRRTDVGGYVSVFEDAPGGDIALGRIGTDIEPELAGGGQRHDEIADLCSRQRIRHIGRPGQHIG
ncbi:hypothetical protein D3C71_1785010 [compost metagenome]